MAIGRTGPADLEKFYKLKKQKIHPLDPIPLRYRLTEEEIARLAVNEFRLEGVQVDAELAGGFMEGVYAAWLLAAGSPQELVLTQLPDSGQPMQMTFKLAAQ